MGSRVTSQEGFGVELQVYGLQQIETALKALQPAVKAALDKEIRDALGVTLDLARGLIPADSPMSGWSLNAARRGQSRGGAGWPAWSADTMRSGIKVGRGSMRGTRGLSSISVAWQIRSTDAAATIFDKAGTKTGGTGTGVQFIKNISAATGRPAGRQKVLWPAWLKTRVEAMKRIQEAIDAASESLNKAIEREDLVA